MSSRRQPASLHAIVFYCVKFIRKIAYGILHRICWMKGKNALYFFLGGGGGGLEPHHNIVTIISNGYELSVIDCRNSWASRSPSGPALPYNSETMQNVCWPFKALNFCLEPSDESTMSRRSLAGVSTYAYTEPPPWPGPFWYAFAPNFTSTSLIRPPIHKRNTKLNQYE